MRYCLFKPVSLDQNEEGFLKTTKSGDLTIYRVRCILLTLFQQELKE